MVVVEKPHHIFQRRGNELITKLKISLSEALTGFTRRLITLDKRELAVCLCPGESIKEKFYDLKIDCQNLKSFRESFIA